MKWLDCLLLSGAMGSTLFTGYVFAVHPLERAPVPISSRSAEFKSVVIHEERSCQQVRDGLDCYHFVVTKSAQVVPTTSWKDRRPGKSTAIERVNSAAVAVLFESGSRTERVQQLKSFARLLERLRERDGIEIRAVSHHSQVDSRGCTVDRAK